MRDVNLFVLMQCGMMCFITAVFSLLIEYRYKSRKTVLVVMQFTTAILMFADSLKTIYDGRTGQHAYAVNAVALFLAYVLIYVELLCLYLYISSFLKKTEYSALERRIMIGANLLGMGLIVISQFNGMFYFIDSNNVYVEGPLHFASFFLPTIISIYCFAKTVRNRMQVTPYIFVGNVVFTTMPLVFGVIQGFMPGASLFEIAIAMSVIIMFALSLVNQNSYLVHISRIDGATRLYNGNGFAMKVQEKIIRGEAGKYNAMYFDIVGMGVINGRFGSDAGDSLIVNYAKLLKGKIQEDEVLGRLGGNFFVALIRKENTETFLKLMSGMDVAFRIGEKTEVVRVSAVVGAYDIPDGEVKGGRIIPYDRLADETSAEEKSSGINKASDRHGLGRGSDSRAGGISAGTIMANISMAVGLAKNVKKVPVLFLTEDIQQELVEERRTQQMFPRYLEEKEFVPYYQPKVDQTTNTLVGAEALSRWNHNGQVLNPVRFIPLMEKSEFVCKLDFYMLECICADLRKWLDEGLNPPVISVNFSRKNLGNPELADEIYAIIKKHDVPPSLIQIEITETVDEYPLSVLSDVVIAIEKYGMTTAIDDFGTGSSSIQLLVDVPFDVLKIDKSFVDTISSKRSQTVIAYIIGMAQATGVKVMSEGVETKEQLDILTELGVYEIQGFYFDRPLSSEVFTERIKNPVYEVE